jgi:hypothetical protein
LLSSEVMNFGTVRCISDSGGAVISGAVEVLRKRTAFRKRLKSGLEKRTAFRKRLKSGLEKRTAFRKRLKSGSEKRTAFGKRFKSAFGPRLIHPRVYPGILSRVAGTGTYPWVPGYPRVLPATRTRYPSLLRFGYPLP